MRELWVRDGGNYDPAALAPHYLDGTAWALERFLYYGTELAESPADCYARDCAITTVRADDLTYDVFFRQHLLPNYPVVVQGVTSGWNSSRDWVSASGTPAVGAIANMFPQAYAPVVGVWADDPTRAASKHTSVRAYAMWWAKRHGESAPVLDSDISGPVPQDLDGESLYLKDWHFTAEHGAEYSAYSCPMWFRDDWLHPCQEAEEIGRSEAEEIGRSAANTVSEQRTTGDERGRDHRFVYLGPKGSTTRVHCDVMASYSWSVNVCGAKRWQLLPPAATPLLYDSLGDRMAADLTDTENGWYGGLDAARGRAIEIIQRSGEAIFVPSGWHHCVENLEDTLSINHNWINACNLHWAVDHVLSRLQLEPSSAQSVGNNDKCSNCSGKEGAAEREARLLAAVVDEAAARAWQVYEKYRTAQKEREQTAEWLKAVYDLRVAQAALDLLEDAGVHTMRATPALPWV